MAQPVARQRQVGGDRQLNRFVQLGLGAQQVGPPLGVIVGLLGKIAVGPPARRGNFGDPLVVLLAGARAALRAPAAQLGEQVVGQRAGI